MNINKRVCWIGLFFVLFGILVNAEIVEVGTPDWRLPEWSNSQKTLYASDGTALKVHPSDKGCFEILDNDTEPIVRRCWIAQFTVNGQDYVIGSWEIRQWNWRKIFDNGLKLHAAGTASFQNFDLNVTWKDANGDRLHLSFAGKNGLPYPIENLRVTYLFEPYDWNVVGSNWDALWFRENLSYTVSENIPNNLEFSFGLFNTEDLFEVNWHPNKIFVGRMQDYLPELSYENPFIALEVWHEDIEPNGSFQLGDIISRGGSICIEDWNAGQTIHVTTNVNVLPSEEGEKCVLTIHPQACVKYAEGRSIIATNADSVILADGNSTNRIVFTSVDDNSAYSNAKGDPFDSGWPCDNIATSTGNPIDENYNVALSVTASNLLLTNAKFWYATTAIAVSNVAGGDSNTTDWNKVDINRGKRGISITNNFDYTLKEFDINVSLYGLRVAPTGGKIVFKTIQDSNFTCTVPRDCSGIEVYAKNTPFAGNGSEITNIFNNRFTSVKDSIYGIVRSQPGIGNPQDVAIQNVHGNVFEDSDFGVRLDVNNFEATLTNFYSNQCRNVDTCFHLEFDSDGGNRADVITFSKFFNNLVEDSGDGFVFNVAAPTNNMTLNLPDFNNNTFNSLDRNAIYAIINSSMSAGTFNIKDITNNIFAETAFALNYTEYDSEGGPVQYGGACRFNGFFNNTEDIKSASCDFNRFAVSDPFDVGQNGSSYLNDNPLDGRQFRQTGFLTVDGNLDVRAARADNYEDVDSNRDLGFHYPIPDLNLRVDLNSSITDLNGHGILTIDFNVGSLSLTTSRLTFDINYSSETRQGTGTALAQGIDANHSQLFCDNPTFNPVSQCHFIFDANDLSDQTTYFTVRAQASGIHAFDNSDRNYVVDNPMRDILWLPTRDYSVFWFMLGIALCYAWLVVIRKKSD